LRVEGLIAMRKAQSRLRGFTRKFTGIGGGVLRNLWLKGEERVQGLRPLVVKVESF
jgi:hypothetical protein